MNRHTPFNATQQRSRCPGFSLVEVMVGMTLFGMLSLGIGKGVIWSLQTSHYIELENIVHANLESYLSQLKALDYDALRSVAAGNSTHVEMMNPAQYFIPPTEGETEPDTIEGKLLEKLSANTNEWSTHTILYGFDSVNGETHPKYLTLQLKMNIADRAEVSNVDDQRSYLLVELEYKWSPLTGISGIGEKSNTIHCIIVDKDLSPDHLI